MNRAEERTSPPSYGSKSVLWLGFLLIGVFLLLQVNPGLDTVTYDESNLVYDGARIVQGQVPYRDFFNFVPPLSFYLMAGAHPLLPQRPETAERYLVVLFVLAATFIWFSALRRFGWRRFEAFGAAAVFPVCLYSFSPFAPHHWFAFTFLILTIALGLFFFQQKEAETWWFLPGIAAGLALCTLQTSGLFACVFIAVIILFGGTNLKETLKKSLWSVLGWFTALALCLGPLIFMGSGPSMWRDLVIWPLTNYHRTGNPNDVAFLADLPERLAGLWVFPKPGRLLSWLVGALSGTFLYACVIGAAVACLLAAVITAERILRRKKPGPIAVSAFVLTVLATVVFTRSNPTLVHLVYALPAVLFLWMYALPGKEGARVGRTWFKYGVILFLATALIYRGSILIPHVSDAWRITDVDRADRDSPLNKSLRNLPWLKAGDRIVVIPTGGNVYLYTYPAAIGYTYFFPLQDHYNDMEDHRIAAHQIAVYKPAAVLIHRVSYADFLNPSDPVAGVLKSRYREVGETPILIVLARKAKYGGPESAGIPP